MFASATRTTACSARVGAPLKPLKFSQERKRAVAYAATAEEAEQAEAPEAPTTWYACVANAEFMLNDIQNESFAEQLREKTRHHKDNDLDLDFFLVCEPKWLDEQHPEAAKKIGRPCVALVGAEENWVRFMKLRLDRVMFLKIEGTKEELSKCGAPVPEFKRLDSTDKWIAPYSPYAPGWWSVFMPGAVDA